MSISGLGSGLGKGQVGLAVWEGMGMFAAPGQLLRMEVKLSVEIPDGKGTVAWSPGPASLQLLFTSSSACPLGTGNNLWSPAAPPSVPHKGSVGLGSLLAAPVDCRVTPDSSDKPCLGRGRRAALEMTQLTQGAQLLPRPQGQRPQSSTRRGSRIPVSLGASWSPNSSSGALGLPHSPVVCDIGSGEATATWLVFK